MTSSREMVLVGGVVKSLRDRGSWTGETHIQKAAYVAKLKRNVPFESDFVLYKHGPFSFDLNKSIGHMLSRDLLLMEANAGYGPSYRLNESLWNVLNNGLGRYFFQFEDQVNSVSDHFARKNVSELERIATSVYVSFNFPLLPPEEKAKTITQLKPHISYESALAALNEADRI